MNTINKPSPIMPITIPIVILLIFAVIVTSSPTMIPVYNTSSPIWGEEDPDYEVIQTVTEGKYFVRPRNGSKRLQRVEDSKSKSQKVKQRNDSQQSDDIDEEEAIEEPDPKQKNYYSK